MTMRVTILNNRRGEGVDLVAGQTYTVSDALGAQLVGAGHATDTDKALTPAGSEPVRASTNPVTGGIELTAGGSVIEVSGGGATTRGAIYFDTSASAAPGNLNDHTNDFVTLFNAINAGTYAHVTIAPGDFRVNGSLLPAITKPCTITGAGAGVRRRVLVDSYNEYATKITNLENNSATLTLSSHATTVQAIRFEMGAAGYALPGSVGILVKARPGTESAGINNKYVGVMTYGFYINIDLWVGAEFEVRGCHFMGPRWVGLRINDIANYDMGDFVVDGNWFYHAKNTDIRPYAGILWESCDGMICTNNKLNGDLGSLMSFEYGLVVEGKKPNTIPFPDGSFNTTDFCPHIGAFMCNSIEGYNNSGVLFNDRSLTNGGSFKIQDNEFGLNSASGAGKEGLSMVSLEAAGTGYSVGNILTLVGGTGTPGTAIVRSVNAGAVTSVDMVSPGSYTVMPTAGTNPPQRLLTTTVAPAGGTGCTLWALPAANIVCSGGSRYHVSDNSFVVTSNGIVMHKAQNSVVGINGNYNGCLDGTTGASAQSALELIRSGGRFATQLLDSSPRPNRVFFLNQGDNSQFSQSSTGGSHYEHEYRNGTDSLAPGSTVHLFTVGMSGFSGCLANLGFSGNQDNVGGWIIQIDARIAAKGGNNLPVITIATAAGEVSGVAATYTRVGEVHQFRNGSSEGLDISILPIIGVTPQLTPRVRVSVTSIGAAGRIFYGSSTMSLRGSVNRVSLGDL